MKIVSLEAENIKRLKAIEIKPDGNMVVIGGENGHGKSSTLDSITYALAGKGAIPSEPINRDAEKAWVELELEDEELNNYLNVRRTFTQSGGGQLIVANKDGARFQSPQSIIDALAGKFTFDPLAFAGMSPMDQLATLKDLVGLDFTEMDEKRYEIYQERTAVNRDVKGLKAQVDACDEFPDVPDEETPMADLLKEVEERRKINDKNKAMREEVDVFGASVDALKDEISDGEEAIRDLRSKISAIEQSIKSHEKDLEKKNKDLEKRKKKHKAMAAAAKKLKDADMDEMDRRFTEVEALNAKVRAKKQQEDVFKAYELAQIRSKNLTSKINKIDIEKAKLLGSAKFPVEGLSFSESGVTYNDIPFEQASDAERLRVSVAMGIASNPRLKILLIRNGSLLDEKSLGIVSEMVEGADVQLWMERVGKGEECSVIIEDGMIAGSD